jgi:hypothetical protein
VTFRTEGHQSLRDCTVASNKSVRGGGIYLTLTDGVARNCLIAANAATNAGSWGGQSGGGIYINDKTGVVVNCTVVNNLAVNGSGGARCDTYGRLVNCVLYTNRVVSGGNHNWYNTGTKMVYSNCFTVPVTGLPGAGNVTGDPRFVDWPAGNYRLTLGSPCVNAGLKENWMNAALDLDRKPRIDPFTSLVDIGAYEYMFVQGTLVRLQ